ncbi:MAG TPA: hypothetical protein PLE10_10065 [Brevefilum sp.]|nr:hypothetical protein [Brevefilum sp.]HOR20153.1 hypothetical protein [Brevefilum sp.]HPL69146.1 hypothetical protein [Brevefilum sp.]
MPSKTQNKNATKISAAVGFIILTITATVLLVNAVIQSFSIHLAAGIAVILIAIGTFLTIFTEGKTVFKAEFGSVGFSTKLFEFIAVFVGSILSFYLNNNLGLGLVVGSALVGLLAAAVAPKYAVPAYCGSFAGMSSAALFPEYHGIILASAIAGLIFVICRDVFGGFGGKLGAMSFISVIAAGLLLSGTFATAAIPNLNTSLWILLTALIAAPLTFYLNTVLGKGPVLASTVISLLAGLTLPVLVPGIGAQLGVVVICSSFTGMSNEKRSPKFWYMLLAGLFTGFLFILSTPLLGGCGGKLGTTAFVSIMAVNGLTSLVNKMRK